MRLVGDRLERLTPAAAALAGAVAVLAPTRTTRARALAGLDAIDAIAAEEELRGERVLDARGCAFAHPLVAAAAREAIGDGGPAALHARAAAVLADDGVDDQRVAEHLVHAPPRGDAAVVATLRRAADAARRVGALTTAARLLERAAVEPPPPKLVDVVDFERGRALLDAAQRTASECSPASAQRAAGIPLRAEAARHLAQEHGARGRAGGRRAAARRPGDARATAPRDAAGTAGRAAFIGGSRLRGRAEACG